MTTTDDYPGRQLTDAERSPRGLGWEYARRKWGRERCPLKGVEARREFAYGFDQYVCEEPKIEDAMLNRGVPMEPKPKKET